MAKKVKVIMPTVATTVSAKNDETCRRKVAGYARVSTDRLEQETSYEAQLDYYTKFIKSHDNWEFVGMYSDM
jgi:site-specific DNA recombinase